MSIAEEEIQIDTFKGFGVYVTMRVKSSRLKMPTDMVASEAKVYVDRVKAIRRKIIVTHTLRGTFGPTKIQLRTSHKVVDHEFTYAELDNEAL